MDGDTMLSTGRTLNLSMVIPRPIPWYGSPAARQPIQRIICRSGVLSMSFRMTAEAVDLPPKTLIAFGQN